MVYQRIRQSSSWNPPLHAQSTQFAQHPFAVTAQQNSGTAPTQEEIENQTFNQNKVEAFGLQLKEKRGTITPVEQERLGVLQTKMDDFWLQRQARAARYGPHFANIPVYAPSRQGLAPVQPQQYRAGSPLQSPLQTLARNGRSGWMQKAFPDGNRQKPGWPPGQATLPTGKPHDKNEQKAYQLATKAVEPSCAPVAVLKSGIESLSGISMDNVKVHYNSSQPAQLNALAYAQGRHIHIAPGQEHHLPHEAWHVVQQAQGRVQPTRQMKGGVAINDDPALEREADLLGAQAASGARLRDGSDPTPSAGAAPDGPIQMTRLGMASGLVGGGTVGGLAATALGVSNPMAFVALIALPALLAAWATHQVTGPDRRLKAAPNAPRIPNLMHFIWLGGAMPAERQRNVLAWKQSTGVVVNLWLDANAQRASAGDLSALRDAGVVLRNISELAEDNPRFQTLTGQLPTALEKKIDGGSIHEVQGPSAAAMSDVARLEILRREGGHYMDSDNQPGSNAFEFKDMPAPQGFRLGWGKIGNPKESLDEGFSNDAMSAVPNSTFINSFLERVYQNLAGHYGPRLALDAIRNPGTSHEKKESVISTTGPNAMLQIPLLPVGGAESAATEITRIATTDRPAAELNIKDFRQLRELITKNAEERRNFTPDKFPPASKQMFEELGFDSALFTRFCGGAWHGENEGKKEI